MTRICFGCGAKLQSVDKNDVGYIPENKILSSSYCMRCFRMTHYGENKNIQTLKNQDEIIDKINKTNKFVIFLIDFLNINTDVINLYKKITCNKMLVINKCELIPKHVDKSYLKEYISKTYNIKEMIKLKGGKNSHGATSILKYLSDFNISEAYLVGITNAGKSTLINDLIKATKTNANLATVNSKKNTTLDFIKVKLNNGITLIDSPGFIIENYINDDAINTDIKAISFNMKDHECLSIFENKYYFLTEKRTPITLYTNILSNNTAKKIFRKIENLDNEIKIDANTDVIIKGLGFMSFKKQTIIRTNIDSKYLELRKSIFGREL